MSARPTDHVPSFQELLQRTPRGSAWGLFGDDDELGTLNFITPAARIAACRAVVTGRVFALNWAQHLPDPPLYGRRPLEQTLLDTEGVPTYEDRLDSFYPQASSQWDAIGHVRHADGFYNGRTLEQVNGLQERRLGIDVIAREGIVGRALLVDLARWRDSIRSPINYETPTEFSAGDLRDAIARQAASIEPGDVLLLRTGWISHYESVSSTKHAEMSAAGSSLPTPGLAAGDEIAEFLWDNRIAAVASDAPTTEAWPHEDSGWLHPQLLALFGMPIGEMFALDELAAACADDGRYDVCFTSAPLNVRGGLGSPPNAIAIK